APSPDRKQRIKVPGGKAIEPFPHILEDRFGLHAVEDIPGDPVAIQDARNPVDDTGSSHAAVRHDEHTAGPAVLQYRPGPPNGAGAVTDRGRRQEHVSRIEVSGLHGASPFLRTPTPLGRIPRSYSSAVHLHRTGALRTARLAALGPQDREGLFRARTLV